MTAFWRLFWLLVLSGHTVAAVAWWWLMPGGFPPSHPRFWVNRVAPIAVLAVVATAVWASRRRHFDVLRLMVVLFPTAWATAAVAARLVFPISFHRLFLLPFLGALVMGVAAVLTFRRQGPAPQTLSPWERVAEGRVRAAAQSNAAASPTPGEGRRAANHQRKLLLAAALLGASLPWTQRAPAPDTRPLNAPMPAAIASPGSVESLLTEFSNARLRVHPRDGSLTVQAGSLRLSIEPVLRFFSRSPDGCATILAPPAMRNGPDLVLQSVVRDANRLFLSYRADYEAILRVDPGAEGGPVRVEAMARLPHPVFSHLNAFCDVRVSGSRQLAISFSPCPDTIITVRPADYPTGRPLRLAYRDAQGGFHIVEAASGEKGPFRELGQGRLERSQPLAITLHDRGVAQARVVLEDWPAQVGTALSPTAGWGLPVNAIEFSLQGDEPGATASIFITLAGTSVGRGWDSVGHRAGTYRNRMRIEVLEAPPAFGSAFRLKSRPSLREGRVPRVALRSAKVTFRAPSRAIVLRFTR
jgi:hypothetical protein